MIFFLFTAFWIMVATKPLQLIIPAVLIFLRSCYVSRSLKIFNPTTLILLVTIFIFTHGSGLDKAFLLVIRVGLFICLFSHLCKSPRSRILAQILSLKLFTPVAYFIFYIERFTLLLFRRFLDVQYMVSVRKPKGKIPFWKIACGITLWNKASLFTRALVSLVFEAIYIVDQVNLVLAARGEIPPTSKWKTLPQLSWTVPLGDVVLYTTVFCTVLINNSLFPNEFHWLLSVIK